MRILKCLPLADKDLLQKSKPPFGVLGGTCPDVSILCSPQVPLHDVCNESLDQTIVLPLSNPIDTILWIKRKPNASVPVYPGPARRQPEHKTLKNAKE